MTPTAMKPNGISRRICRRVLDVINYWLTLVLLGSGVISVQSCSVYPLWDCKGAASMSGVWLVRGYCGRRSRWPVSLARRWEEQLSEPDRTNLWAMSLLLRITRC